MGYCTELVLDVRIQKERILEFRQLIEMEKHKDSDIARCFLQDIIVQDDGCIEYDDYYGTHYGDREFAQFIAPFVEEGELELVGEDSERWGYYFCGDGRIRRIEYIQTISDFILDIPDTEIRGEEK